MWSGSNLTLVSQDLEPEASHYLYTMFHYIQCAPHLKNANQIMIAFNDISECVILPLIILTYHSFYAYIRGVESISQPYAVCDESGIGTQTDIFLFVKSLPYHSSWSGSKSGRWMALYHLFCSLRPALRHLCCINPALYYSLKLGQWIHQYYRMWSLLENELFIPTKKQPLPFRLPWEIVLSHTDCSHSDSKTSKMFWSI